MITSTVLYKALLSLREQIREKLKQQTGRSQSVCGDAALAELARVAPRNIEQLTAIPGLGKTFAEKYGKYFIAVLTNFHKQNVAAVKTTESTHNTLEKLADRLVNLGKRNRMLYSPKLTSKHSVDLFGTENLLKAVLEKQGMDIVLYRHSKNETAAEVNRYKRFTALLREVNKEFKETGQADLYIAYPFVKGKMLGDDFSVRAPLCLFPVSVSFEPHRIAVRVDTSQEILYNTNLILLHNKLNKLNREVPDASDWDFNREAFFDNMLRFYLTHGINIPSPLAPNPSPLVPFKEYLAKDFPRFNNGEFELENAAVLGRYSLFSVAIQKDFKKIIDEGELNSLINELIASYDDIDIYAEPSFEQKNEKEKPWVVKEESLCYINSLNSSQESAILSAKQNRKLVIQGPPGTGKSQTIISLIADYVANKKTVLMVSQKQAALNVIYSRLGNLSNFAVMLCDTQDKKSFYSQIRRLVFSADKTPRDNGATLDIVNFSIDQKLSRLTSLASALFAPNNGDTAMYKIYQENTKNSFKSESAESLVNFSKLISASILKLRYSEFKRLKGFLSLDVLQSVKTLLEFFENAAWLKFLKPALSKLEHLTLLKDIDGLKEIIEKRKKKNAFSRLFDSSHKKALNLLKQKWFTEKSKSLNKKFLKNPNLLNYAKDYYDFTLTYTLYNTLNENQKLVASEVVRISKEQNLSLENARNRIFDFFVAVKIDEFETNNSASLGTISAFKEVTSAILTLISQKKAVTRDLVLNTLIASYQKEIEGAKRGNELRRQIERQRLPSIPVFINKFQLELFRGIKIWFMTPESVAEALPHTKGLFDLVVFDEASQLYVEKALPSITRGKEIVISGDHKQLRPNSLGIGRATYDEDDEILDDEQDAKLFESNAALEEESLLDLARWRYPQVLLNYHYRSRFEELIAFSNYAFYDGKLQVSPNKTNPKFAPIEVLKVEDGRWINRANKQEAVASVNLLKVLLEKRQFEESIGIITFNSTQRDMILDIIDDECRKDKEFALKILAEKERKDNGEDIGLFVKNIENVQGDERDIIIFSLGYARNEKGRVVRNFGWLNQQGGENRLNVGITRAKQKIFFICSITPQELFVDDLKGRGPLLLKKYLEYVYAVSRGDKKAIEQVLNSLTEKQHDSSIISFDSEFEREVFTALTEAGFLVDTQVGIGGYRIDLAIKDKETGNYLLGIECDGKLYHSSRLARERDIHRQNYLESRGWKIHRIWSTNWWHNPKGEIEKILTTVSAC